MAHQCPPIVVVIAGPTATGKSDVASQLCSQQKGMIISADSVQAYQGVQIGANKPSLEERKETPHILIDVADHTSNYNAAEWREDAIFCIQTLLGFTGENNDTIDRTLAASPSRRAQIEKCIEKARIDKGYADKNGERTETILPVVCGGTMMYLQWLVRGRPDAMRPTSKAVESANETIRKFQESENDYEGAIRHVASFGNVFAERSKRLASGDWYRLQRTLEIALTAREKEQEAADTGEDSDKYSDVKNLVEQLYSGEREGSLASLGYDVRCFFLCPDDRMGHTRVIDKRCEQMLLNGLLEETTELNLSGSMPEMAERAIGYRQTLDYLNRKLKEEEKEDIDTPTTRAVEEKAFEFYLNEFTTATRRYAVQQMKWFRKDSDFMFVPIPLKLDKSDRVNSAVDSINRLCQVSREEYETELFGGEEFISGKTKRQNEEQGKTMKFYKPERHILIPGSKEYKKVLAAAIECRSRCLSKNGKKRMRENDPNKASKN